MSKKINKNKILVPTMGIAGVLVGTIPFISGCTVYFHHEEEDPEDPTIPKGVSLDQTSLNLISSLDGTLNASVIPSTASQEVEWSSSNEDVATVVGGVVHTLKPGTTTITVKPVGYDYTATCEVTVNYALADVSSSDLHNANVQINSQDFEWLGSFTISDDYFSKGDSISPTINISFINESIIYFNGNNFFGDGETPVEQASKLSFTPSTNTLSIRFYIGYATMNAMSNNTPYNIKITLTDPNDGTVLYENKGDGTDGETPFTITRTQ